MSGHAPDVARLAAATRHLDAPFAVVDLAAFDANADDLVRRAGGRPIRVASKSVRCRALLRRALARPGFAGVLAYSLREGLWLAGRTVTAGSLPDGDPTDGDPPEPVSADVVLGYPTVDRGALAALLTDEVALARVTLMIDDVTHLDLLDATVPPQLRAGTVRLAVDLDASLRLAGGRVHLGVRRSPVHSPADAAALARAIAARRGVRLVGLLGYEAQVAGLGDAPAGRPLRARAVRAVQRRSIEELRARRGAAVAAVRAEADLEFVNGGGTGSLETTAADPAVTEVAAGSGLLGPTLFDGYRAFRPRPAALFAVAVVRRPGPGLATLAGGGWVASGPPGPDRLPTPVHPPGLRLLAAEGAGEVQTPVRGAAADRLGVGDLVWFRHAKAGELSEHLSRLHLVPDAGTAAVAVPTYRGDGHAFG
jgi:D-serine deaminase-like pyridoxal phosphate-dependent protein